MNPDELHAPVLLHPLGQRDARRLAVASRQAFEMLQLGGRLDVEEQDTLTQTRQELIVGLAHAREDDLLRVEPGPHHPIQLAARDDICPGPQGGQRAQDGEVPVGLYRVADHMLKSRESLVELPVCLLQSTVAVDVGRCTRAPRDLKEGDVLAPETALPVVEVVQSLPPPLGSALPAACCILGLLKLYPEAFRRPRL